MTKENKDRLTGQILSFKTGDGYDDRYWVDLTIKLISGDVVNVHYLFKRESIRDNIVESLAKGMMVSIAVDGGPALDTKFDYAGIGSIKIQDLSNELDRFLRNQFKEHDEYFNTQEIDFINQLLFKVRDRIIDEFEASPEVMEKVEEHLDTLARQSSSVTKYDWRRLFVTCVVSISIDLGFGVSIPEALFNLFKKLAEELLSYKFLPESNV